MLRFIYSLILIILSGTIFTSCVDSGETPDTTAPEIVLKGVSENQKVKGVITIAATAADPSSQLSMQVFLDGNLIKESSVRQISVEVNTKTLSEGIHAIKITATDKAENSSEKMFDIDVRNTLFKAHVSSNYVPQYTQIYFTLTRNDGSLIAFNHVENGSIISTPTPADFNPDSSFVLTEYFYLNQPASMGSIETLVKAINVSAGLRAGEFFLQEYAPILPIVGSHHVKVTEVPTEIYYADLQGSNISSVAGFFGNSGIIEADLDLRNNTSDLYFSLTVNNQVPVYNYINNIQTGGSTLFSFTGLPQMQKAEVTTTDMVGSYRSFVYSNDASPISLSSHEGNFDNGKIPVFYPAIYPQYHFLLRYQLGSNTYENRLSGTTPPTSFQYLNAVVSNVNYVNRKLKVTSTGTYDIMTISASNSNYDGTKFSLDLYTVSFPNGTTNKVTIPNTPAELSSLAFTSPADFSFTTAGITDYLTLSGSSDYQNEIVFSADNVLRSSRDYIFRNSQITPTSSGGRLLSQKKIPLPKQLESILRNRFYIN